jgi:hypothetical protein
MYYATGLPGWARAGYPYGQWGYHPPFGQFEMPRDQELEALREHVQYAEKSLEEMRKRISELEAESAEK